MARPRARCPAEREAYAVTLAELARTWRADVAVLRRRGCDREAALMERLAGELEAVVGARDDEALPLAAAAEASGYSMPHLRRMVAQGRLANVGTDGEIRVRRADLPRKPGATAGPDLVGPVLRRHA